MYNDFQLCQSPTTAADYRTGEMVSIMDLDMSFTLNQSSANSSYSTSSYPTNNPDMSPRSSMPKFYLRLISKNPDMSPWRKEDFLDFLFLLEM